jgi:hypothetical protein
MSQKAVNNINFEPSACAEADLLNAIRSAERMAIRQFRFGDIVSAIKCQNEANTAQVALAKLREQQFRERSLRSAGDYVRTPAVADLCAMPEMPVQYDPNWRKE